MSNGVNSIKSDTQQWSPLPPLVTGVMGISLLLPASIFMTALTVKLCFGSAKLYYYMAWEQPWVQWISGCLLLAILFNLLAVLKLSISRRLGGWMLRLSWRRSWLNTAIILQGSLLLLVMLFYILIRHIRYDI